MSKAVFALVGPGDSRACGIRDYVMDLFVEFKKQCNIEYLEYSEAMIHPRLTSINRVFLHYEASLVPSQNYLQALSLKLPGKLRVIPHEVYDEDPFAFPYGELKASNKLMLWIKQFNYRRRHQKYYHEKILQGKGYYATGVIPLSQANWDILKKAGAPNLETPVPHAYHTGYAVRSHNLQPLPFILGLFGFINPANDYKTLIEAVSQIKGDVRLLLIGGDKKESTLSKTIEKWARSAGMGNKIEITGYVSEDNIPEKLNVCSAFVCPYRFRSNSGSLLKLIQFQRPIFASRIPLTEELVHQGVPAILYDSAHALKVLLERCMQKTLSLPKNHYRYDFQSVVKMYLNRVVTD